MPAQSTFAFKARDSAGTLITGQLVASSAEEVSSRLRAEGKWVLGIEEFALRAGTMLDEGQLRRSEAAKRVRREDVIAFAQQISVMLETGVPLFEALESFCKQTDRPEFRQVLEVIVDYLKSRIQFDRPIGSYQALKHPTVDVLVGLERARSHLYHAATVYGTPEAEVALRMAKAASCEAFAFGGDRAVQFHGGFGFTYECDAQLYLRRALWCQTQYGDPLHQRKHLADLLLS